MSAGWGGARPGTGPKVAGTPEAETAAKFDVERAEHERVKRLQREFALAVEQRKYLPRDAQRQASSTALAVLTQSLRAIRDNLERTISPPPEVLQAVADQVDAALRECAAAFRAMSGDDAQ